MTNNTVMIVDDIESNRMLLKMILEDDYTILESASGSDCLNQLQESEVDIVLLDVNMPGMTGYEVCTEIRKQPNTATTPVVFISAMDNVEERLAGFEAGGNDAAIRLRMDRHLFAQQLLNRAEVVPLDVAEGVDGVDVVLASIVFSNAIGVGPGAAYDEMPPNRLHTHRRVPKIKNAKIFPPQ